jgi:YVTN family beta-propeller protein
MNGIRGLKHNLLAGLAILLLLLVSGAVSAQPAGHRLYVANNDGSTVSVLDPATGAAIAEIGSFTRPSRVWSTADGSKVYMTHGGDMQQQSEFVSIDTRTNSYRVIPLTSPPGGMYLAPNAPKAFISLIHERRLAVLDTTTDAIVGSVEINNYPFGAAVNRAGTRLYVANTAAISCNVNTAPCSSMVTVFDLSNNSPIAWVPLATKPTEMTLTPDEAYLYVVNDDSSNSVSIINTANNTLVTTLPVGRIPYQVVANPVLPAVYVSSSGAGAISVINTSTMQLGPSIPVGSASIAIEPSGQHLYATTYHNSAVGPRTNTVVKISLATNQPVATFSTGAGPFDMTYVAPLVRRSLSVSLDGSGQGSVSSAPAGISCVSGNATGCSAQFDNGAQVTLTAAASVGSVFVGWRGCSSATSAAITLVAAADTSCTATFRAPIVPQVGWWSTPSQPGRGYGVEASNRGGPYKVLLSVFAKKRHGEGGWFVAELDMKADASGFAGPMFEIDDAQELLDIDLPKRKRPLEDAIGNAAISMTSATEGTLTLPALGPATPAATVSIQRYEFVEGGLSNPRPTGLPQAGWWTSPEDSRWATFFEVQTTSTGQPVLFGAFHRMQKKGKVNSFFGTATLLSSGGNWLVLGMPLQDCKESIDLDITGKKVKACKTLTNQATTLQFLGGGTSSSFTRPEGKTSLLNRYGF